MPERKLRILFLCTGNSCRSQMAEGWTRKLKSDLFDACSAGVAPKGLNPLAVQVMREVGVDISGQQSRHIDDFRGQRLDYVVTVCDHAHETCPVFPETVQVVHIGFDDPPALARDAANEEEALAHYRRVRDEIRKFIEGLPKSLAGESIRG